MPQCLCTWCSCNFPLPAEMLPNLKGLPFHQCLPFLAQQLCPTNIILFLSTCHTLSSIIGWLFSHSIMSNSCDPMDHNPPGTSVHEISQTRIMEQAAISFSTTMHYYKINKQQGYIIHHREIQPLSYSNFKWNINQKSYKKL